VKTSSIRWAIVSALTALAAAGLAAGCDGVGSRTPATLEQGLVPPPPRRPTWWWWRSTPGRPT